MTLYCSEDVYRFELPGGPAALVDRADRDLVDQYVWAAQPTPYTFYVYGYRRGAKSSGTARLHRVLLEPGPGLRVDHINHNGLDNRRSNLRLATPSQNNANSRLSRRNTSGYKGVTLHKATGRWQAFIGYNGMRRGLGYFDDAWEAAQAYNAAALEIWGDFAWVNTRKEPQ